MCFLQRRKSCGGFAVSVADLKQVNLKRTQDQGAVRKINNPNRFAKGWVWLVCGKWKGEVVYVGVEMEEWCMWDGGVVYVRWRSGVCGS